MKDLSVHIVLWPKSPGNVLCRNKNCVVTNAWVDWERCGVGGGAGLASSHLFLSI